MKAKRICLDACPIIALQNPSKYPTEVVSAMQSLMASVESGHNYLVVSTVILAELLDGSLELLEAKLDGRKGEFVDADMPIMALARKVRNKIIRRSGPKEYEYKCLDLPDCVYVATAKVYDCDYLVTIEGLTNNKHTLLNGAADIEKQFGVKVRTPMKVVDQHALDLRQEG